MYNQIEDRKFQPLKVQCGTCKDIFWSRYSGEYRTCKCGASAIDTTSWYSRFIGNPKAVDNIDNDSLRQD